MPLGWRWAGGWAVVIGGRGTTAAAVATAAAPSRGGGGCLECLQDVVRALSMGSCLTAEQPPAAAMAGHGGKAGEGRRREDEALGRIAGSGVGNAACLFTRQGRKGTNQDAMVVWEVYTCFPPLRSPFLLYEFVYLSFSFLINHV